MTKDATWERRLEVLRDALSGEGSRGYAFLTASMALIEAKDSNDYERTELFRKLRKALTRGTKKQIATILDELEAMNHE